MSLRTVSRSSILREPIPSALHEGFFSSVRTVSTTEMGCTPRIILSLTAIFGPVLQPERQRDDRRMRASSGAKPCFKARRIFSAPFWQQFSSRQTLIVARVSFGRVVGFIVSVLYHRQLPLTRVLIRGINNILQSRDGIPSRLFLFIDSWEFGDILEATLQMKPQSSRKVRDW